MTETKTELRHFTVDGTEPVCGAAPDPDERLVWFARSVTCADCLEWLARP